MCCGHGSHHGGKHGSPHHGDRCACGGSSHFGPCFWTKEEKIAWLEEQLEDLRADVKTLEERIVALKGEG